MKPIITILLLAMTILSCSGSEEERSEELKGEEVILPFDQGGVQDAEAYFYGVLDDVLTVDEKLRYVQSLDDIDASSDSINSELDSMLIYIEWGMDALSFYEDKDWPQRHSMESLTEKWYIGVKGLVNDFLYRLVDPMSRPDDTWTEEDKAIYAEYENAIYTFYDLDEEWVAFQYKFATANDFELVDEDELP